MKRVPLRRRRPLRSVSAKRRGRLAEYAAFRAEILARDGYRCSYCLSSRSILDLHHTLKPRSRHLCDGDTVLTLCRACHRWVDAPYSSSTGRLVIERLGAGRFGFFVVYGESKFTVRAAAFSVVDNHTTNGVGKPVHSRWTNSG